MVDGRGEITLLDALAPQRTQNKLGDEGENERAVTINSNNGCTCIGITRLAQRGKGEEEDKQNERNEKKEEEQSTLHYLTEL